MSEEADEHALAENRTDLATDRTLLANERTFAGWMRTGMACLAIALGFHTIFSKVDPTWIPKVTAIAFVVIAFGIFQTARRNSCRVINKLQSSNVEPFRIRDVTLMAHGLTAAGVAIAAAIWFLEWG